MTKDRREGGVLVRGVRFCKKYDNIKNLNDNSFYLFSMIHENNRNSLQKVIIK